MNSAGEIEEQLSRLRRQINDTETQLSKLRDQLHQTEAKAQAARDLDIAHQGGVPLAWQQEAYEVFSHLFPTAFVDSTLPPTKSETQWPLTAGDYRRYGRQLIVPEVGLRGQLALKASRVLIVGAGGLGCPAAAYLAGAGVGNIGIMDGDIVEASNLHRQVAHSTSRIGRSKVDSAIAYLKDLNPTIDYTPYERHLVPDEAIEVFKQYDIVLDCTDHPTSRYLISDACVLTGTPLVSAAALRTEGQLVVLNDPPRPQGDATGSPCYRCIWPTPPPPNAVVSCGEGGILGPVVGIMGVLQALEAIKVITSGPASSSPAGQDDAAAPPSLLMFSAFNQPPFRSVRIRSRRKDCAACSAEATISPDSLTSGSLDYVAFCGADQPVNILENQERVDASDFAKHLPKEGQGISIVDVRPQTEYELCKLDTSINIPWTDFAATIKQAQGERPAWLDKKNIVFVCRMGNDSQKAVRMVKEAGLASGNVVDIRDGFRAWRQKVDPSWPDY